MEQTREDYIRRLAQNRYDFRQAFRHKLHDTAEDDWKWAEEVVNREIASGILRCSD